jgi:hypothetical protein
VKVVLTSSKRIFEPYRIDTPVTEIMRKRLSPVDIG